MKISTHYDNTTLLRHWEYFKKHQSEGGNSRQMTQDDGKTKYTCSPHSCGYNGDTYCQNCGYTKEE